MAKGQISKNEATSKILELFPGSFVYDKEIRIPYVEEGEEIQLKCTLTCAKVNVSQGGENAIPGEDFTSENVVNFDTPRPEAAPAAVPTEEEKQNLRNLLETLGL